MQGVRARGARAIMDGATEPADVHELPFFRESVRCHLVIHLGNEAVGQGQLNSMRLLRSRPESDLAFTTTAIHTRCIGIQLVNPSLEEVLTTRAAGTDGEERVDPNLRMASQCDRLGEVQSDTSYTIDFVAENGCGTGQSPSEKMELRSQERHTVQFCCGAEGEVEESFRLIGFGRRIDRVASRSHAWQRQADTAGSR